MGHTQAAGMAEMEGASERALSWHLTSNHFPPHDPALVPVAQAAIEAANAEDWEAEIELPDIVTFKGRSVVQAWEMVEALHLEAFLG